MKVPAEQWCIVFPWQGFHLLAVENARGFLVRSAQGSGRAVHRGSATILDSSLEGEDNFVCIFRTDGEVPIHEMEGVAV